MNVSNILDRFVILMLSFSESKIQSICAAKSNITTKEVRFLQSHSYTNPRTGDTDCKCSVEVDQCDAKVEIYTVHLDLPRL